MNKTLLVALVATVSSASYAQFLDTFDSIDSAWVTDRYEPNGFAVENFMGDNRLKITIDPSDSSQNRGSLSGAFYNTQGRQRGGGNIGSPWYVGGSVYISNEMISGDFNWRTDLWTRNDEPVENNAWYGIFGAKRFDDADAFNPNSTNKTNAWRIWDANNGGWAVLGVSVTEGWHDLMIESLGATANYYLNGSLVYTDVSASTTPEDDLRTVFVQGYNFGDNIYNPLAPYSVYWDNIYASTSPVPEPATMAVLGLGALAAFRRRNKK